MKVHGSALEYTVRPHRERFLPYALEGSAARPGVLVGSRHTAESLWEVMADEPSLPRAHAARARPGWTSTRSGRGARRACERLGRARRVGATTAALGRRAGRRRRRCARSTPRRDRIVSYVGKLIVSKGVDLLLAAWPLVVARVPDARLVVVGFGTYRDALRALRGGAAAPATSRRCGTSPRAGASSRAGRPASCAT